MFRLLYCDAVGNETWGKALSFIHLPPSKRHTHFFLKFKGLLKYKDNFFILWNCFFCLFMWSDILEFIFFRYFSTSKIERSFWSTKCFWLPVWENFLVSPRKSLLRLCKGLRINAFFWFAYPKMSYVKWSCKDHIFA